MTDITPLSADALATLVEDFEASDHNRMAMNAVTAAGINKVARNYDRARLMQRRFSTIVDNGTATHQDRSGRCWLFSSLNVARFVAKKNMGLKEFEFSQNYAMYYDKLERVNYFLQDVAELAAFCAAHHPDVAVLCIPRAGAKAVAPTLVEAGVKGYWNFSHYDLSVDYEGITVENVHLGDSLMSLGYRVRND